MMRKRTLSYKDITPKLQSEIVRDFGFFILYGARDDRTGYHTENDVRATYTPDSLISYLLQPEKYTLVVNPEKFHMLNVELYRKLRGLEYTPCGKKLLYPNQLHKLTLFFDIGNFNILVDYYKMTGIRLHEKKSVDYVVNNIYPHVLNFLGVYTEYILKVQKPYIVRHCAIDDEIVEVKIKPTENFLDYMVLRCDNFKKYVCSRYKIKLPIFDYKTEFDKIFETQDDGTSRLFATLKSHRVRDKNNNLTHIKEQISTFDKTGKKHNTVRFVDMLL